MMEKSKISELFEEYALNSDNNLIVQLLDIYVLNTGVPVGLYLKKKGNVIWPSITTAISPLCKYLMSNYRHRCDKDHSCRCESAKGVIEKCYAGLWNLAMPIYVDDEHVATLMSGQVRLNSKEKDAESFNNFDSFLQSVSEDKRIEILKLFDATKRIHANYFNEMLMNKLINIYEYVYDLFINHIKEDYRKRFKIQCLSHDFLLMVQAMLNKVDLLRSEFMKKDVLDKGAALASINDVLYETEKLIYFSKNMIGSMMPSESNECFFEEVNTFDLLTEVVSMFQGEALNKRVVIHPPVIFQNDKELDGLTFPLMEACRDELKRAFCNLVHNSVKYSYSGNALSERFIELKVYIKQKGFLVEISNFGTGIKHDEIASGMIFKESYRGELSRDRNRAGSGIGLFEVQKIIKKHNGAIDVKSSDCGSAYKTVFLVYLPYRQDLKGGER